MTPNFVILKLRHLTEVTFLCLKKLLVVLESYGTICYNQYQRICIDNRVRSLFTESEVFRIEKFPEGTELGNHIYFIHIKKTFKNCT